MYVSLRTTPVLNSVESLVLVMIVGAAVLPARYDLHRARVWLRCML